MANESMPSRLDRLKGPRPSVTDGNGEAKEERAGAEAPEAMGPPQGSEQWRTLYEKIREATIKLRS